MAPRETENNAYANFWGDKQRAVWYVMVFSGVVNSKLIAGLTEPAKRSCDSGQRIHLLTAVN